jgi:hypothetical protein
MGLFLSFGSIADAHNLRPAADNVNINLITKT